MVTVTPGSTRAARIGDAADDVGRGDLGVQGGAGRQQDCGDGGSKQAARDP